MADHEWRQYSPDPHRRADEVPPSEITPYQPPDELPYVRTVEERTVRRGPTALGGRLLVLVLAAVTVVAGFVISRADHEVPAPEVVPQLVTQRPPGPQTPEGFARLLDELRARQGSTLVYEAVLDEDGARLRVPFVTPVAAGDGRAVELTWDGTELTGSDETTESNPPYDLAQVGDLRLTRLCARAKALLTSPTGCYLIVEDPGPDAGDRSRVAAWASGRFDTSAVVWFDQDGVEVKRREP